jgi:glycerophosphoryl diester phosphodiesterase
VLTALEIYDVVDRSLVQSFDWSALGRLREMSDALVLGALIGRGPLEPPGGVQALNPSAALATDAEVVRIRAAGLECYVWTVNDPPEMDRLIGCGASGIITDYPAVLRARVPSA